MSISITSSRRTGARRTAQAESFRLHHQQDTPVVPHQPDHWRCGSVRVPREARKGSDTVPPIERQRLDSYLKSHLIESSLLRADSFDEFMTDRQQQLLNLIEHATGKAAYAGSYPEEGIDLDLDEDDLEAEYTMAAE